MGRGLLDAICGFVLSTGHKRFPSDSEILAALSGDVLVDLRPTACRGCRFYAGETHFGTTTICAIHPYGVEGESCGDWEAER